MWTGSGVGVLSEFSRSSVGELRQGIREGKETAILIKVLFCNLEFLGRSLVRPWFLVSLFHGADWVSTREGNLNKSAFCAKCRRCHFVVWCRQKARWWQQSCGSGLRSERWVHKTENARRMNAEH